MTLMMIMMTTRRLKIVSMYRYTMYYPVTFIDDDCIAPPDKGSYIHYIVVFTIILPIHIYYIH